MSNTEILTSYGEFCEWAPSYFLIISENVFDPLIYYSHLLPMLLALPLALAVFLQAPRRRLNVYLFTLVSLFALWSFFDLILWAHEDASTIMFFWSMLILLEPLIYLTALVFAYYALYKKGLPLLGGVVAVAGILPTLLLLPSELAIESFNLTNCYREVTEGSLVFYGYAFQIFISLYILFELVRYSLTSKETQKEKKSSIYIVVGILLFLLIFSSGNIIGSFLEDWTIGQYGIYGMPILVAFLGYTITKYHVFKSKIIATELLVGALSILILSILFIQNLTIIRIIVFVSFLLIVVLGMLLIRSVRQEVEQRKEIEQLAQKLKRANKRLRQLDKIKSEFVSIASHQLRSPLTSIRGYASMIIEGSYGKIPKKANDAITRISESSQYMATTIEDFLNVSRIEAGKMKYEMTVVNMKDLTRRVVENMKPTAVKKGLSLKMKSNCKSTCNVHADIGKLRQVLHNLIDNAMKYTPEGSVTVTVFDNLKKNTLSVSITDTGVGITEDMINDIFDKFVRAKNANEVNVSGSGLGLFVAKQMTEHMGGTITVTSEGKRKGSTFTIEMPLSADQ